MNSKYKTLIIRIIAFSTSTLAGFVVDMLVLWVFSRFVLSSTYAGRFIFSNLISFECAVLANFICAYFFVWRDRISQRSAKSFLRHYLGYNLSSTGGYFIQQGAILLFSWWFSWDVLICKIPALCISGGINFALNEWVVFRKKNFPPEEETNNAEEDKAE